MLAVPAGDNLGLLCSYMHSKTGTPFDPNMCQGFAIINDKYEFVGAAIISNIRYDFATKQAVDCEISCASDNRFTWRPHVCEVIFKYVFHQLKCVRCTSITRKNNAKARAFLKHLNFELEGNIRKGYDGEHDALIYGLLAEDCRFLGGLNG